MARTTLASTSYQKSLQAPPNQFRELIHRHSRVMQDVLIVLLCLLFLSTQLGRKETLKNLEQCMVLPPAATESPLREMVLEKFDSQPLSEEEQGLVEEIQQLSDLELRTMVIAETVVPVAEQGKLIESVERQLATSRDVIDREQAAAIIEMLRLLPSESSLLREAAGDKGSLTSYAALALVKQQDSNLHFMLTAMKAEPHLRWRALSKSRRNEWKGALAKFLTRRVVTEVKNKLLHQDNTRATLPVCPDQ